MKPAWFRRRWAVALATALAMALTFSLGLWQLSRAGEKLGRQRAIDERAQTPMLDGRALAGIGSAADVDAAMHRPVRLRGVWLPEHSVLLSNRVMEGRTGFHVLTPLALEGGTTVLVLRGWAPRDVRDPYRMPEVPTPMGVVEVEGRVAAEPSRLMDLPGSDPSASAASAVRHNLSLGSFAAERGLKLAPFIVQQTGDGRDGLDRRWPVIASGAEKHYGYAFQWFGLCALMAVLYVWLQIILPWRHRRRAR